MSEAHGWQMLIASVAVLALGPLLHRLAKGAGRFYSLLDGFVVVAVLGLALLEIVPLGIELAGWSAVLAALLGLLLPNLAERRFGGSQTHKAAAWAALLGMAFHAFTDGLAVAGSHVHADSHALEWAVIIHRVPVGLAVWWMLTSPNGGGQRPALLALLTIALATVAGFFFAGATHLFEEGTAVGLLEAFVGGLLLHVVSHGIGSRRSEQAAVNPYLPGIGGVLGLGFVLALFVYPELGEGRGQATLDAFLDLVLESAPALLIAYGVAGIIGSVMGEAPARWLRRGGAGSQSLRGVLFGLPLPLCSCGVVPVYKSLIARRVPATAALAFLIATPELGLDAILLSLPLLGAELALARVIVAFLLALAVGWLVGGWAERRAAARVEAATAEGGGCCASDGAEDGDAPTTLGGKLLAGLRTGYGDVLDSTGPWILVGLLLAAFIQPWVDGEALTRFGPLAQVPVFALIGLPVYVCATGATPLVAVLIAKGLSPGAALAFLLTGPATNVTTFGVLEQLHGRKLAVVFVVVMIVAVLLLGWGVNLVWPALVDTAPAAAVHEHEEHGLVAIISAVALGLLFLLSLVRQGPRAFLGRLWEQGGHDHDDHDHDDHEHGSPAPAPSGGCCS